LLLNVVPFYKEVRHADLSLDEQDREYKKRIQNLMNEFTNPTRSPTAAKTFNKFEDKAYLDELEEPQMTVHK